MEAEKAFGNEDVEKLCWLFGNAEPDKSEKIKGPFVGPRKEMITPWSTNAVEITQSMGLEGISRIEEYFPVASEDAEYDPMLQRMYPELDSNVFTTNRKPEPIIYIDNIDEYNEQEGLALSKEEIDYLHKVENDLGRKLTDSEVFGFAQINSEHCRHKIFGGTFIIDGEEKESSLFQLIKNTTKENPNRIESDFYFTDESSLEIYTNGMIRSAASSIKGFIDGDKNADTHSWDGQASYFMDNYSADDASNWDMDNWSQLRNINYYLANMRKAEADEAVLNHYEGVGRFFRAFFYYVKVKTFGAVPWYDAPIESTDTEALFKDRDNREYVCSKILEDLNYACTYCSDASEYRVRASYIHRYVALAFKARFCLYEGTFRKYHKNDPSTGKPWTKDESEMYLRECISACEENIASGIYSP